LSENFPARERVIPLSLAGKFSDKPVGGKVRSSEGEVPRLPPYKYQGNARERVIPRHC